MITSNKCEGGLATMGDDQTGAMLSELKWCIHQLNNMLTVIQGNAELIKLTSSAAADAEDILVTCERSKTILERIRILIATG